MNRKHVISVAAVALLAGACAQAPKDHFVLRGVVPGAMDSTEVDIRGEGIKPVKGYIIDGKFELQGKAELPTLCRLSITNQEAADRQGLKGENAVKYVEANVFIENGDLVFSTPHIDSLPQSFWRYDIRRENNYTLTGSASHEVFDRYRRRTMELQAGIRNERYAERDGKSTDAARLYDLQEKLRQETRSFIASQRNLAVNLQLAEELKPEPFTYTQEELDALAGLFADYTDTIAPLRQLRDFFSEAAAYTQGAPFAGGQVHTPEGDTTDLRQYAQPGRYTLIDFWASWCGPCRTSFPHLRKTYEACGKDVTFLSVSLDKSEDDWRKAMQEEQLPWTQLRATPAFSREIGKTYKITSIPTFLLISPDGRILFSGHDSNELDMQMEKIGNQ